MPGEPRMSIGWKTQRQNASARQQRRQSLRRPPISHATATLRSCVAGSKSGSPCRTVHKFKYKGKDLRCGDTQGARGMRSERGGCPPPSVCMRVLRQVVTERGKYHVVDRVSCRGTGACSVHSGPGIPDYVGILRTPLEAALRSIVEAIPEAEGALNDVPSVAVAIGKRVGDETIGAQHGRGVDGSCGSRQRQRLNGATVVPAEIAAVTFLAVLPAAGVFTAHVGVNIQLRRWVEF